MACGEKKKGGWVGGKGGEVKGRKTIECREKEKTQEMLADWQA